MPRGDVTRGRLPWRSVPCAERFLVPRYNGVASSVGTAKVSSRISLSRILRRLPDAREPIAIEAGREEPGLAFLIGLVDGERRLDSSAVHAVIDDARQARSRGGRCGCCTCWPRATP